MYGFQVKGRDPNSSNKQANIQGKLIRLFETSLEHQYTI